MSRVAKLAVSDSLLLWSFRAEEMSAAVSAAGILRRRGHSRLVSVENLFVEMSFVRFRFVQSDRIRGLIDSENERDGVFLNDAEFIAIHDY